jgi:hypothetical protein
MSIFCDLRTVLYAEFLLGGYYAQWYCIAWNLSLIGPAARLLGKLILASVGRLGLTTLGYAPSLSLSIVTFSRPSPRLARGLSPFYPCAPTFEDHSLAVG